MISTKAWPSLRSSLLSFFWGCIWNVFPGWTSALGRSARTTVCVVAIVVVTVRASELYWVCSIGYVIERRVSEGISRG